MPHRDRWDPERDRSDERDPRRRDLHQDDRPDDLGQADYSTDYAYDARNRTGYRTYDEYDRGDSGQADFSEDYAYDPRTRTAYLRSDADQRRAHEDDYERRPDREARQARGYDERGDYRDRDRRGEPRSWMDGARDSLAGMFGARSAVPDRRDEREYRRERVERAVIAGRLEHERGLDASDIHVTVDGSEVVLDGTVRSREEKRRAEDLVDVRGVTHVQNNLRVRQHGGWWR